MSGLRFDDALATVERARALPPLLRQWAYAEARIELQARSDDGDTIARSLLCELERLEREAA